MSKKIIALLLIFIVCSAGLLPLSEDIPEIGPKVMLDIPLFKQETDMWCWAASVQMILTYMGESISQCDQADDHMARTDCCDDPAPEDCIRGGWPQFFRFGFQSDSVNAALSWEELKAQIDAGKPVLFSWRWELGGGHMMVATGYAEPNWVYMNNPWPPHGDPHLPEGDHQAITYSEYVSGANHTHWRDYFNISRKIMPEPVTPTEPEVTIQPQPRREVQEPAEVVENPRTTSAEVEVASVSASAALTERVGRTPEFVAFDTRPEPLGGFATIQNKIKYPDAARRNMQSGRVVINVLVDKQGQVVEMKTLQSSGVTGLDEAAMAAIESTKWKPAMQRDKPVNVWVAIPINFKIR